MRNLGWTGRNLRPAAKSQTIRIMENIYSESLRLIHDEGSRFNISLAGRTFTLDGKEIISKGEYEGELGIEPDSKENVLEHIEELYFVYKHSIPSERSDSRRYKQFYALPEDKLDADDMMYGERRETALFQLEFYILASILNGSLVWDDDTMGKWFWKSPLDGDLIILRQWVVGA